jgi:hypothetical protein
MSYEATIRVPDRPVGKKDIVFTVRKDRNILGRLKVSKGAVVWLPGNKSKGFLLKWDQFARLAEESGRRGDYPV